MDRTVMITGASRGIGKACALAFAKAGWHCILTARQSEDALMAVREAVELEGVRCLAMLSDAASYEDTRQLFERARAFSPSLDAVVNNAAIASFGLFTDLAPEEWQRVIGTNLTSVYNICRHAVPWMLQEKQGAILNISSIWGQAGASCEVAYSAAKGGVDAFTKALAKELAPSGIRVNAISCGVIDTDMNRHLTEEERSGLAYDIPMGRFGTAEEVADLALFLATEKAAYITGGIIPIHGGGL